MFKFICLFNKTLNVSQIKHKCKKRKRKTKQISVFGKVFVLTFYEYLRTKETYILVRGYCRKIETFIQMKDGYVQQFHGLPFCYSLHNSEYLVHSMLRPPMIGLIRSLELVDEEIVL